MTNSIYTLAACENLMANYAKLGGDIITLREGVLGLGLVVCIAAGHKTAVIQERYLNEWSSCHTIRMYNHIPDKYKRMIEEWENEGE